MPADRPDAARRPSILIAGDFAFPYGTGASSRVFNYAKGLQAAGARVNVMCVEPGGRGDATLNVAARGEYRGVPFEYTYGRTTRPRSAAHRRLLRLLKWPRFLLATRRRASEAGGLDAMLVYSRSLPCIGACWLSCRLHGATLLHEDCELPYVWKTETPTLRLTRWTYQHVAFKAFDGCLVISHYLDAYCRRYLRPGARTLLVPILVDVTDVSPDEAEAGDGGRVRQPAPEGYVAFAGSLDHPEVHDLLTAFAAVASEFPQVRLQLIGAAKREASLAALQARIGELHLEGRVDFPGALPREQLFARLRGARVLALPRPAGAFSQAGLPTKVAEYLASGTPAVLTAVGDLPLYLRDGVDAYLAPPGDPQAFAARLRDALADPGAAPVGRQGRQTAAEKFDPAEHGRRIMAFIGILRRAAHAGAGA
jgi:glycosyltransferase involved in cell wall biosynthesis